MKIIENQRFDEERALYGSNQLLVKNCSFDGPADGESAFKECSHIEAEHCFFNLRYPFWHDNGLTIRHSEMTTDCPGSIVVFRSCDSNRQQTPRNQSISGMQ